MTEPVIIGGATLYCGDCRSVLATLPDRSVQACVTSPPYFNLRDYGVDGQIGLEQTPDEYVAKLVAVFREVRRVLRDDGTLWLNLGDSYANDGKWGGSTGGKHASGIHGQTSIGRGKVKTGLKPKDLIGIPWMVAFALRADGWYLRSDIIWHKPNPMPESVKDRPTKAHEYVFMLSKSEQYYFGQDDLRENASKGSAGSFFHKGKTAGHQLARASTSSRIDKGSRNIRSVWTVPTQACKEAHFAVMTPDLAEKCIKGGAPAGGVIIDPFSGAGTTSLMADRLQRRAIAIELNPEYHDIACKRLRDDMGPISEACTCQPEPATQEALL